MKSKLMMVMMVALFCCLASCDNQDNSLAYSYDEDDIKVDFYLQNEEGEITNTFKVGENIIFNLEVYNASDEYIDVPGFSPDGFLGKDVFRVYSSSGEEIGVSWEYGMIREVMFYLYPHKRNIWSCPWMPSARYAPVYPFVLKDDMEPLPAGDYYSEFNLTIDQDHIIPCKIDFKVLE